MGKTYLPGQKLNNSIPQELQPFIVINPTMKTSRPHIRVRETNGSTGKGAASKPDPKYAAQAYAVGGENDANLSMDLHTRA